MNTDPDIPGAVILGGTFACMAAARNLASQGISVCIIGPVDSLARYSRATDRFIQWPQFSSFDEIPAYLARLAEEEQLQGWTLFPCSDEHLRIVAKARDLLAKHYALTTPDWATVHTFYDKRLTSALACRAGVPSPWTRTVESPAQLADLDLAFPVVLKPAISSHFSQFNSTKAFRVENRQELVAVHAQMSNVISSGEVLLQEFLPDPGRNLYSYAGYFHAGEPLAGLAAKRTRQFPRDFGRISTCVESADIPELRELSSRLMRACEYTGLAEVEFMWNERRQRFELLEVNARLWAWHGLAAAAGLDLPCMAHAGALGKQPLTAVAQNGVTWFRCRHDLRVVAKELHAGTLNLRDYLASFNGPRSFAVFAWSDPLPFIVEPFLSTGVRLKRSLSKRMKKLLTRLIRPESPTPGS